MICTDDKYAHLLAFVTKNVHICFVFMQHEHRDKMNKREENIIEQAFIFLQAELGKKLRWEKSHHKHSDFGYDGIFSLEGTPLYIEAKNEVRPNQVPSLISLNQDLGNLLVVANYITPNAKKLLREKDINYIDRVGNIWLKIASTYIHIEGRHNAPPSEDKKTRAFSRTGLKVVFQFLQNPDLVNATYREIVEISGASLGTIPKVIAGLKTEGFLLKKTDEEWIITRYEKLLNRWQYEYTAKLKPALFMKRYRSIDQRFYTNWKDLKLQQGTHWGGEPAGDLLTDYLKPEVFTLYTNELQQDIMKNYRWIPDPEGDIWIYNTFWPNTGQQLDKYVSSILAYADLMGTGDSRCIETAKIIYEQSLQKF